VTAGAEFVQLRSAMFAHYAQGQYAQALSLLDAAPARFPDQVALIYFWRACLLSRLSRLEEAVAELQHGLDEGAYFSEPQLRGDSDLAPLQGRPDFERVAAVAFARYREAMRNSRSEVVLFQPEPVAERHPLLVALHGRSGNARLEIEYWRSLTAQGWFVAAVQSSQIFGGGAFCWDDQTVAERDVTIHVEAILATYPCDPDMMVLTGFSQGAQVALRLALIGKVTARGTILVAPSIPPAEAEAMIGASDPAMRQALRCFIIAGEQDAALLRIRQLQARLTAANVPCELLGLAGLAHDYPDPFEPIRAQAIAFVTSGG
jgi:predicted esterase